MEQPNARPLGVEIVSASCTGDKGMPAGRCMPADSTRAAYYSHLVASTRSFHRAALHISSAKNRNGSAYRNLFFDLSSVTLTFFKNHHNRNRPYTSLNEIHLDGVRDR